MTPPPERDAPIFGRAPMFARAPIFHHTKFRCARSRIFCPPDIRARRGAVPQNVYHTHTHELHIRTYIYLKTMNPRGDHTTTTTKQRPRHQAWLARACSYRWYRPWGPPVCTPDSAHEIRGDALRESEQLWRLGFCSDVEYGVVPKGMHVWGKGAYRRHIYERMNIPHVPMHPDSQKC